MEKKNDLLKLEDDAEIVLTNLSIADDTIGKGIYKPISVESLIAELQKLPKDSTILISKKCYIRRK